MTTKDGLPGFGIEIAHQLACAGFGDSLLTAALTMSPQELKNFIPSWRQELHSELSTNASGHLTQRHPALANSIPHDFPDINLLLLYAKPLSSWSPGMAKPDLLQLQPSLPDISKLAGICERRFGWENNSGGIIERFHNTLWDGACIRMLCYKVSCYFP
jgi:holliday junction resolvase YEN1